MSHEYKKSHYTWLFCLFLLLILFFFFELWWFCVCCIISCILLFFFGRKISLLSSEARIQAPWIKVAIGDYTFGVVNKAELKSTNSDGFYTAKSYESKYPNYIKSLNIIKINGQVNQYTLSIEYPVRPQDDPNFFEKVFGSVSKTRKIVFSYGDSAMPTYVYKDEEAIITKVSSSFNFGSNGSSSSVITYTVNAISSASLGKAGSFTFIYPELKKPSDAIKEIFKSPDFGLQDIFTGMSINTLDSMIAGTDKAVEIESKENISPLDEIIYLTSCMIPDSNIEGQLSDEMYILTIHDDTTYDKLYNDSLSLGGPYFKVEQTSSAKQYSDAYEIDLGFNSSTIVTNFSITNNENYSIYYDYTNELYPEEYKQTLNNWGNWESTYAPAFTS